MALKDRQREALRLLTCGQGYPLCKVAELANISYNTLHRWLTEPQHIEFQEALKEINDNRWQSTIDVAREACLRLCANDNQKMVEFVLKNAGYNPSQKVEADVNSTTVITVSIDGEDTDGSDTIEAE